jgi:hypothetical protein
VSARTLGRVAFAVVLTTVTLAACGGDDDDSSSVTTFRRDDSAATTTTTGSTGEAPAGDDCAFVTTDELDDALDVDAELQRADDDGCGWTADTDSGPVAVTLDRITIQIDVDDYMAGSREVCDGDITEVDAGDDALACVAAGSPSGSVVFGDDLYTFSALPVDDPAPFVSGFADLLPSVRPA